MRKGILIIFALLFIALLSLCSKDEGVELVWYSNLDSALIMAEKVNRPLLVEFSASWCPYCRIFEDSTLIDINVKEKLKNFVLVRIDVDKFPSVADSLHANARKYGGVGIPNVLFLKPDGEKIKHVVGLKTPSEFCAILDTVSRVFRK